MANKGVLRGAKISNKHSTVLEVAEPVIVAAKRMRLVTKVVISFIVPVGPGKPRIKFRPVRAGLRMVVRGQTCQQEFFVYTGSPGEVSEDLREVFEEALR